MNSAATQIDSLVTQIAKLLVDCPEDVLVKTFETANTIVMELHVANSPGPGAAPLGPGQPQNKVKPC